MKSHKYHMDMGTQTKVNQPKYISTYIAIQFHSISLA